jgi:transposase InsO family protein
MKIIKLLTDNGNQFTDRFTSRFTSRFKEPSARPAFDLACNDLGIKHRLAPLRHPQTNEMAERFNGRISELVNQTSNQTRFASAPELKAKLGHYLKTYNHHIPQRALHLQSPVHFIGFACHTFVLSSLRFRVHD